MSPHRRPRRHPALRRMRLAMVGAVALALVAGVGPQRSAADDLSDKQNQRNQLGNLISQLQVDIQTLHTQEAQLRALIGQLDQRIAAAQHVVDVETARLDQLRQDLADSETKLVAERARLERDRRDLASQIKSIYEAGSGSTITSLFESQDFNQFWNRLLEARRIADQQNTVVDRVRREEEEVAAITARIDSDTQQQTATVAALTRAEDDLKEQRRQQAAARAQLQQVEASDQQQLALAEQSAREVDAEIAALQAEQASLGAGPGNGTFAWAERGEITQGFGCTPYAFEPYDPNCPSRHFHSGIDIAAPYGTPVVAGAGGVCHTYWSSYGYGNHIICVHGGGFASLYGHLSGFAVGDGAGVGRGQTIGYEGSTGNSTGPHLHYEIRLNGSHVNPLQYLA